MNFFLRIDWKKSDSLTGSVLKYQNKKRNKISSPISLLIGLLLFLIHINKQISYINWHQLTRVCVAVYEGNHT
jgi:hypothetical protein